MEPSSLYKVADKETLIRALETKDTALSAALRKSARAVSREVFGNGIYMRGLVEVSNVCARDCLYCGIRKGNTAVRRYRMTKDEIVQRAELVTGCGLKTIVMQAGENVYKTDELCEIVRTVKQKTGIAITLSFGEFSRDDYFRLAEAGADRYLLRHETADPALYEKLHPGYDLAGRLKCLDYIREAGFEVGSGFMVGLPGQTVESMLKDMELLVDRRVDMAGIGPYVSNPDTPLNESDDGNPEVVLNVLAILRHALPGCNLPATTALDSLLEDGREQGINAGANVVMPVMTPEGNKEQYTLYPNKRCLTHNPIGCVGCSKRRLAASGYQASEETGWSKTAQYLDARRLSIDG